MPVRPKFSSTCCTTWSYRESSSVVLKCVFDRKWPWSMYEQFAALSISWKGSLSTMLKGRPWTAMSFMIAMFIFSASPGLQLCMRVLIEDCLLGEPELEPKSLGPAPDSLPVKECWDPETVWFCIMWALMLSLTCLHFNRCRANKVEFRVANEYGQYLHFHFPDGSCSKWRVEAPLVRPIFTAKVLAGNKEER